MVIETASLKSESSEESDRITFQEQEKLSKVNGAHRYRYFIQWNKGESLDNDLFRRNDLEDGSSQ